MREEQLSPHRCFTLRINLTWWLFLLYGSLYECETFVVHKYSTRVVRTKYGPIRGILTQNLEVEAFLGVPYATPPLESLRYMPPVIPSSWKNIRLADSFSHVCPQKLPDIANRTEALLKIPRGRLVYLEKLLPLLANQSEDCLYVNVYVPKSVASSNEIILIPTVLFIHGESYEWNAGNPYDGSALANYGNVIVVTINYRLGILGFLKTGTTNSSQGNYGLMDIVAGLHWLKENLSAFGGDPDRITIMGHGTGAALANFIAASPATKELLHRVILLSGSALSPWALQKDPLMIKRKVAEQTNCHGDLAEEDMAPCLRLKKLQELMSVNIEPPRFLPGFAPFIDKSVLFNNAPNDALILDMAVLSSSKNNKKVHGFSFTNFPERDLLFGLTTIESYPDFCAQDLEFGFMEAKRDRMLRTFVRNCYYFHLNEIFAAIKNEYTDWVRPAQNPFSIRDSTLDILSDGHTASYLLKMGYLHSVQGGRTYFFHFSHHLDDSEFPQKTGSIKGDDLPFILGFPLLSSSHQLWRKNFTTHDSVLSMNAIRYISNFIKKGDPNAFSNADKSEENPNHPFWNMYDSVNQLYLELAHKPVIKSHYRGHKMSIWLNLIPQLHRPGFSEFSMQHHYFKEQSPQYYDGLVRLQSYKPINKPLPVTIDYVIPTTPTPKITTFFKSTSNLYKIDHTEMAANCTNFSIYNTSFTIQPQGGDNMYENNSNLLRKIVNRHYQNYTIALTITVGVGCFLLLLNIIIFANIYQQRENIARSKATRKKSKKSNQSDFMDSSTIMENPLENDSFILNQYNESSPQIKSAAASVLQMRNITSTNKSTSTQSILSDVYDGKNRTVEITLENLHSPNIPEPPPPPKSFPGREFIT